MKHPEFLVPTQMQVERKVKPRNLWWVEYYTDFCLVLVSPSSSIVNQKLLVLKAASSILGCFGGVSSSKYMLLALAGFFSLVVGGISLDPAAQSTARMTREALKRQVLELSLSPVYPAGFTFLSSSK